MNLTKLQINKIKVYLQEQGFKYMDVQMEILDHVATAVEERMTENSNLNFEDAVNQTQASFGPKGFKQIEKSIVSGLKRKYNKIFFKNLLSFFSFKYIYLVSLFGYFLYQLQKLIANPDDFFTYVLLLVMIMTIALGRNGFKSMRYKKYMSYKISGSYMACTGIFMMLIFDSINKPISGQVYEMTKSYLIVSVSITFFTLYILAAFQTAKSGISESSILAQKYSELDF